MKKMNWQPHRLLLSVEEIRDRAPVRPIEDLGYRYATLAGFPSASMTCFPSNKETLLKEAQKEIERVQEQYTDGLITDGERYNKVIDIWAQVTENIAKVMLDELKTEEIEGPHGKKGSTESFNPIYMMADSGARGSAQQVRQLAGMRGLMAKPSGEIIETPITANFREGLKGVGILPQPTALGLAIRLKLPTQISRRWSMWPDVVITEHDWHDGWHRVSSLVEEEVIESMKEKDSRPCGPGRCSGSLSGEVMVKGTTRSMKRWRTGSRTGIEKVKIRSVLTVEIETRGLCPVLRPRFGSRSIGEWGRGDRHYCCPVDRRTGNPIDHADLPYRGYGEPSGRADHARISH
jgi:DNA-directed RNA polymerase subunit beta'